MAEYFLTAFNCKWHRLNYIKQTLLFICVRGSKPNRFSLCEDFPFPVKFIDISGTLRSNMTAI